MRIKESYGTPRQGPQGEGGGFAEVMEGTNPQSWDPLITGLALLVGLVTLYIVVRQLRLMGEQQATMRQQLDILQKQDELLAQRADLRLIVSFIDKSEQDPSARLRFIAENVGNKTAKDFYWHLHIPIQLSGQHTKFSYRKQPLQSDEVTKIGGTECRHFRGINAEPVYPSRAVNLGTIGIDDPSTMKQFAVYWQFIAEDGKFPSETELGKSLL